MVMKMYATISLAGSVWHGAIVSALSDVSSVTHCIQTIHINISKPEFIKKEVEPKKAF